MTQSLLIRRAARIVLDGGIVAYPTEGVYGLGCLPGDEATVERLLQMKQRSIRAGLILIAADFDQLNGWITPDAREKKRIIKETKYPLTWIVTAADAPDWLTGGRDSLAVRITTHPVAAALCREVGSALVSTSANRRGRRPALTALGVRRRFAAAIDCVLPGPLGIAPGRPSEIRDARSNAVLRPA